jgi:hypothetical protein
VEEATSAAYKFPCIVDIRVEVSVAAFGVTTATGTVLCIFLLWPASPVTELSLTSPAFTDCPIPKVATTIIPIKRIPMEQDYRQVIEEERES